MRAKTDWRSKRYLAAQNRTSGKKIHQRVNRLLLLKGRQMGTLLRMHAYECGYQDGRADAMAGRG